MSAIDDLTDLHGSGRLLPFVGAGLSMGVRWNTGTEDRRGPSWSELVDQAAQILGFDDAELLRMRGDDLQILEYFRRKQNGEMAPLRNWLVRELNPPDDALRTSPVHAALARLQNCNVQYTTNFDDFLERSLRLHGRTVEAIATESDLVRSIRNRVANPASCEVVKFHGDLNHPDQMVLSEYDYRERLQLRTPMDARLRADLLGRSILFLGYSFRDWNVSYLFHLVNSDFLEPPDGFRRAYITVADPSEFEIELFRARHIEVVPLSGEHLTSDIAALLERIAGKS